MGYHRPVSQYNFGKKSEFYSRNYFKATINANKQLIDRYGDKPVAQKPATATKEGSYLLFTTNTCPKCPAVKKLIAESSLEYSSIDNTMSEFIELTNKYRIQSVPTLLVVDHNQDEISRIHELSEIQELITQ
ncbi:hypothetical protein CVV38_00485 [Candidatus Peregrinibacteria bacterium HGW-Peregrinibacteria-1]|nr:MAG: hypothetical protein CVV38_00485 [Candidatus Peregrinibacteria bacterium HGW-Peregrinibacteria-1]